MEKKQTLEFFSGSKSYSKVREEKGDKTFTIDFIEEFNNDLTINILDLNYLDLPNNVFSLWASPPCTSFSVASIGKHWIKGTNLPKTKQAKEGLKILEKTISLISEIKPKYWYIENPRGKMRKVIHEIFKKYNLKYREITIWYCKYGDIRAKPTNIWTNNFNWIPREQCKNYKYDEDGNIINKHCHHESARRGTKGGTQGLKNDYLRSQIPKDLFIELYNYEK